MFEKPVEEGVNKRYDAMRFDVFAQQPQLRRYLPPKRVYTLVSVFVAILSILSIFHRFATLSISIALSLRAEMQRG